MLLSTYNFCFLTNGGGNRARLLDSDSPTSGKELGQNEYMLLGTVAKKVWQRGLQGSGAELGEVLRHTSDFKKVLDLKVEPGRWYPAEEK